MSEVQAMDVLNITVLFDPRSTAALMSMKYHYIPILAVLSQMITFNLNTAVYPAERFGDDYYNMFGQENYVQNCISFLEPNMTERLAILDCIIHCELCIGMSLCPFVFVKNQHTPGCIKRVKGDLNLLVKCELRKRGVSARAYQRYLSHWSSFHPNSSNPIVLLINDKQQVTKIMDTGLLKNVCAHLSGEDKARVCKKNLDTSVAIPRILIDDGIDHIIISQAQYRPGIVVHYVSLMVMANIL